MFKLILILLAFGGLLLLLLGFSVLRVLKWIFVGGTPSQQKTQQKTKRTQTRARQQQNTAPKRKKIIEQDEGEYVEFEEVKEFK